MRHAITRRDLSESASVPPLVVRPPVPLRYLEIKMKVARALSFDKRILTRLATGGEEREIAQKLGVV